MLRLARMKPLKPQPGRPDGRVLLLNVESFGDLSDEARHYLEEQQAAGKITLAQDQVDADYSYWTADEILTAILPEGLPEGTPTAFTMAGHLAHVNLRDEYAPYRYIIGQVLLDKNDPIRTVVNKLDTIDNEFRFFQMERLAGEDKYEVTMSQHDCTFTFDFRSVYWNSRLNTEHGRLLDQFRPFEVISDVMAGVGPFSVPAARKGCYVLANDLNPASYQSMLINKTRNQLGDNITISCEDGRAFIRNSIQTCWNQPFPGEPVNAADRALALSTPAARERARRQFHLKHPGQSFAEAQQHVLRAPARRLIDHFVMNLPASALEFLDAYRGAYKPIAGAKLDDELACRAASGGMESAWPLVHVHCFTKDLEHPFDDICRRANSALGIPEGSPESIRPNNPIYQPDLNLHLVRSVAPNKDMYCLTFRLTRAILFDTL